MLRDVVCVCMRAGVELPAGLYVSEEAKAEALSEDVKAVLAEEKVVKKKKSKKKKTASASASASSEKA